MLNENELNKIADVVIDRLIKEGYITSAVCLERAENILRSYSKLTKRKDKESRLTVARVNAALETIRGDEYYDTLYRTYILGDSRSDIASALYVDPSTVSRNRIRLLRRIAPLL